MISKCRSCGAEVIWTKTEAGKNMPVDVDPNEKGNIVMLPPKGNGPPRAVYVDLMNHEEYRDEPKYLSHFATCPDATGWRKK